MQFVSYVIIHGGYAHGDEDNTVATDTLFSNTVYKYILKTVKKKHLTKVNTKLYVTSSENCLKNSLTKDFFFRPGLFSLLNNLGLYQAHLLLYRIVSYRIVSYRIVSYRIVSYRIVLYYIYSAHVIM